MWGYLRVPEDEDDIRRFEVRCPVFRFEQRMYAFDILPVQPSFALHMDEFFCEIRFMFHRKDLKRFVSYYNKKNLYFKIKSKIFAPLNLDF